MPELPEVETVVLALRQALIGRVFRKAYCFGKLRLPFDAAAVTRFIRNRPVSSVRRRAKYILLDIGDDRAMLAHLGMTGSFRIESISQPRQVHDRVAFSLDLDEELRFSDSRRFGFIQIVTLVGPDKLPLELADLGPEPLSRGFTASYLIDRAERRGVPVKTFIMNQEVVVGVGNIYASEALYAACIDPRRPAGSLSPKEWALLVKKIKIVLRRAIRSGGSTIRNYRRVDGSEGAFQRRLLVYDQAGKPCPGCGRPIERVRQGGRSTYFCPGCQR